MIKKCALDSCGDAFTTKNKNQRFCSSKCRLEANRYTPEIYQKQKESRGESQRKWRDGLDEGKRKELLERMRNNTRMWRARKKVQQEAEKTFIQIANKDFNQP